MVDVTLTRDAFLGGKLHLWQPAQGYRAGVDPVFLAASVQAKQGDRVLELGCGVGTAMFCLGARVPDLALTGVERDAATADLARRNAQDNGLTAQIITSDLAALPPEVKAQTFDHVLANPPYFKRSRSIPSPHATREAAMGEQTPLSVWVEVAAKRLAPKGTLTMIQSAARLPELLGAVSLALGSVRLRALQPREGRPAQLVLVQARKGGRADFVHLPPLILHQGPKHERDGESYRAEISSILRSGTALPWES